jgi:hypothetical protein
MTDRQTLHQLIEELPASQLVAAEDCLTYLHGEKVRETLTRVGGQPPLYDTDFYAWAQQQAAALRALDWAALDLNNLIEEVEDLAGRHRDALGSELKRLLVHLMKWHYQPTHRSDSWLDSIEQARQAIDEVIDDYPSLADYPRVVLPKAYQRARRQGARETKLPLTTFPPEGCPWALDDIRREGWLPPDAVAEEDDDEA